MGATKAATATPRASANVTVGFGLVNVPIAMKPLAETKRAVSGKYVCLDHGANLEQRYLCSKGTADEHLLDQGGQITAYPHPDTGEFVVVDKSVLDSIAEDRDGRVEVDRIVDASTIDPIYFDKTYLCWPQAGGESAFDLLAQVLRNQGKAAEATVVLSKQTVPLVLRWSEEMGTLVAHTCRFQSEIRWADANLIKAGAESRPEASEAHVKAAEALMESMAGEFEPGEVVDNYTPRLQDAIRAAAGGKPLPKAPATKAAPKEDLLGALMASVKQTPEKPAPKKAPAKKKAA